MHVYRAKGGGDQLLNIMKRPVLGFNATNLPLITTE
jgi:hypothetical protein